MFEKAFKAQAGQLTNDKGFVEQLWLEIEVNYSTPARYYHNLSHLDNVWSDLLPADDRFADRQTLLFSVAYHDIIYEPLKNDNEEKSAEFAFERLGALSFPLDRAAKCCSQIMATKGHARSTDSDSNYFTDADLAILGKDEEEYRKYSIAIRKEYQVYPDLIYRTGRKKVLKHFLDMPQIYKTDFFRRQYEDQARINLSHELKELSR